MHSGVISCYLTIAIISTVPFKTLSEKSKGQTNEHTFGCPTDTSANFGNWCVRTNLHSLTSSVLVSFTLLSESLL